MEQKEKKENIYKGWGYGVLGYAIVIAWWLVIILFAK